MDYTGPSSLNIGTDKQREAFKKLAEQYGDLCNLCGERGHWANECDTVHKLRDMEKNKAFHQYNQPIMPPPPPTAAKSWNQSTASRNPYTAPRNPYAKRSTGGAYHTANESARNSARNSAKLAGFLAVSTIASGSLAFTTLYVNF
jgi:hypothetical protein